MRLRHGLEDRCTIVSRLNRVVHLSGMTSAGVYADQRRIR